MTGKVTGSHLTTIVGTAGIVVVKQDDHVGTTYDHNSGLNHFINRIE